MQPLSTLDPGTRANVQNFTIDARDAALTTAAPRASAATRANRVLRRWTVPVVTVLTVSFLILYPVARLVQNALGDGGSAMDRALDTPALGNTLVTTAQLAFGSLGIALVLGLTTGLASCRLPQRFQWMSSLPLLPLVIPAVANIVGWAMLFSPQVGYANTFLRGILGMDETASGPINVYSVYGIIISTGLSLTSFVYVFVRSGLMNINSELHDASATAGARTWTTILRITLPTIRPAVVYGAGVALLLGLGQFTAPLLLGVNENVRVLSNEIYFQTSEPPIDYAVAAALGLPLLAAGVVIVVIQRFALRDRVRFVTHSGRSTPKPLRPTPWAVLPILLYAVVTILLPLGALIVVALSPFYSRRITPSRFSLDNFSHVLSDPSLFGAIKNSVAVSVVSVLIVLVIGYVISELLEWEVLPTAARAVIEFVTFLPVGVPAVIFGAGFLFAYTKPPLVLYGSTTVLVLVYVTLMIPYATRLISSARVALGKEYGAAARASGANALRTHLDIYIPLLRPAMGGAAALMFVLLTHEFAASLLVRSQKTEVMGTVLYGLWTTSSYPKVAAMALVMCVISGLGVGIAMVVGGGRGLLDKM